MKPECTKAAAASCAAADIAAPQSHQPHWGRPGPGPLYWHWQGAAIAPVAVGKARPGPPLLALANVYSIKTKYY